MARRAWRANHGRKILGKGPALAKETAPHFPESGWVLTTHLAPHMLRLQTFGEKPVNKQEEPLPPTHGSAVPWEVTDRRVEGVPTG